jgi:DNA-binding HxlR family transcriptional regulator
MQNNLNCSHKKRQKQVRRIKANSSTISERMLARQLEELVKDGILTRKSFGEVPPKWNII